MAPNSQSVHRTLGNIVKAGLFGAGMAAAINVLLYLLGRAMGSFPATALTQMGRPVDAFAAAFISVIGVAGATVVYALMARFMDKPKANRWFTIIAIIVLVLMIPTPFGIPGAPVSQIVIMEIMHLVTGLSAIYFLTRWHQ
jgi:hypothetical protein